MERAVHRRGVRAGVLRAEQVGPTHRADEQRPAGQQQERLVRTGQVGDRVADVLGGVAGRVEGREPDRSEVERVAITGRLVRVAELGAGPDDVAGTGQRGELAATRHVVVVEVGLEDVADPQARLASRIEVDVDVAPRVDDRGHAGLVVGDEGREMTEPLDPVLGDAHGRSLHRVLDRQRSENRGAGRARPRRRPSTGASAPEVRERGAERANAGIGRPAPRRSDGPVTSSPGRRRRRGPGR